MPASPAPRPCHPPITPNTCLLPQDVLSGRKTGGVITGDIRVNGEPLAGDGAGCGRSVLTVACCRPLPPAKCPCSPPVRDAGFPKVHKTFARVMGYVEQTGEMLAGVCWRREVW